MMWKQLALRVGWAVVAVSCLAAIGVPVHSSAASSSSEAAASLAVTGPYVTLLFSRTEITAADNCVVNNTNIARLDSTVAPYLAGLGMKGTGTIVTGRTKDSTLTCTHSSSSMTASWAQATQLNNQYGWSFTSHTATYPGNLAGLTAAQSDAETCGSARTLDARGLRGAHGLISYPGAQPSPVALQTNYSARCFAWGRQYGAPGVTQASAGTTAPYWQQTHATNGGPCNVSTAPCYTITATGSQRYQLPSKYITTINNLGPGKWMTMQAYVLVRGKNPAYSSSPIRWDCTSTNVRMHWTNDNERYCYQDWQAIIRAIDARADITVTDPLSVGVAFGRPATYPSS